MKALLDTSSFLWLMQNSPKLSPKARKFVDSATSELYLSLASAWELAIKVGSSKLRLAGSLRELICEDAGRARIKLLEVKVEEILAVEKLPDHHRDPFDRLLACQAQLANLPVISSNEIFDRYGLERIW